MRFLVVFGSGTLLNNQVGIAAKAPPLNIPMFGHADGGKVARRVRVEWAAEGGRPEPADGQRVLAVDGYRGKLDGHACPPSVVV